jgi:two-component system, OmpR family, alkaline phosphatase synthesis response regulator PhoP
MHRILIVEDNPDLAFGLRNNLEIEGYDIIVAEDGLAGLQKARDASPDLIILDLMMPGMDGYRVLRTLREEGNDTPVLILSAKGEEADKVRGFRMGADDFVTKPFSLLELLGRVQALLRRSVQTHREQAAQDLHRFGDIVVDEEAELVTRAGEHVPLTPREFTLLMALVQKRGTVVSRQQLLRLAWGHQSAVISRTVDTHIAELRRKLERDPAAPQHIVTVHKKGYRLQD